MELRLPYRYNVSNEAFSSKRQFMRNASTPLQYFQWKTQMLANS